MKKIKSNSEGNEKLEDEQIEEEKRDEMEKESDEENEMRNKERTGEPRRNKSELLKLFLELKMKTVPEERKS
jgi:hypothetical protein